MLGIPVGFAVFGAGEWAIHKHVLHGLGADRASRFSFHVHDHHQSVHRHGGYDPAYEGPPWSTPTQAREALGLLAIGLAHVPLFPLMPLYTGTIWYCLYRYRRDHRRAHLDPAWARDHLPWHYDHHLGPPDKNYGVSWSWFDVLVGTREVFVGTVRERLVERANRARAVLAASGAALRAQRRNPLRRLATQLRGLRPPPAASDVTPRA